MMKLVVLFGLVAAASASGLAGFAPLAYTAPLAYSSPLAYSAPLAYSGAVFAPSNYRGPLSLAPGQPANILAADGRPLDTLEVNLDRSAHYTAKALDHSGIHLLKKRSVSLIAPYGSIALARSPALIAPAAIAYSGAVLAPSNYRGPLSLAPGQPANILAADGRPLDTLEVNLDRSAHFTAKALDHSGIHLLKKRSVSLIAPYSGVAVARSPLIAPAAVAYSAPIATSHFTNLAYSTPLAYTTPLVHW